MPEIRLEGANALPDLDWAGVFMDNADLIRPMPAFRVQMDNQGRVKHVEPEKAERIENGQPLWEKILTAVRVIYEPAYVCIAGGAIRDGNDAKDIDVFIHLPDDKFDAKVFVEQAEELGWRNIQKPGKIDPYLKDNKRGLTQAVCKGIVDGWSVDLIVTKATDGEKIVGGFDFHINEQWYDGELHQTKKALYDMKKGHWTPSRALTADTKAHFERVNKRLGGRFKLNTGEPWYMKFQGKEKLK